MPENQEDSQPERPKKSNALHARSFQNQYTASHLEQGGSSTAERPNITRGRTGLNLQARYGSYSCGLANSCDTTSTCAIKPQLETNSCFKANSLDFQTQLRKNMTRQRSTKAQAENAQVHISQKRDLQKSWT